MREQISVRLGNLHFFSCEYDIAHKIILDCLQLLEQGSWIPYSDDALSCISYLCIMRRFQLILILALNCVGMQAQFNTIGNVPTKVFNKQETFSPKQEEVLTDSIEESPSTMAVDGYNEIIKEFLSVSYPLKNIKINSGYGMRKHPIMHRYCMHNGIDLHARQEDVFSMLPGEVIRVGQDHRSGKFVTVKSESFTISYCHLSRQYVQTGDFVRAGEPIGFSGSTGMSTGEHLHLTTKKDGKAFDPTILIEYVRYVKNTCLKAVVF